MSLLIFAYRKQGIIARKADLNYKLMQLKEMLFDLQDYSSSIADGSVSLNDMMHCPPSMFNRMSMFMMYSHQASMAGAQQKYGFLSQTPGAIPQMPNEQLQANYNNMVFKNLYEQEHEKFKKQEERILNQQDKKIEQESNKIQQQLSMLDKELESINSIEEAAVKNATPKYVA